ncbi:Transposase for insertion sequence element IS406 [Bienertia sinuspersici]
MELAKNAGPYDFVNGVYYQIPMMGMEEGLRNVVNDNDVRAMAEETDIAVNQPLPQPPKKLTPLTPTKTPQTPQKTPQIQPTVAPSPSQNAANIPQTQDSQTHVPVNSVSNDFLEGYDWIDPRPEEPIPFNELLSYSEDGSSSDSLYKPGSDFNEGDGTDENVDGDGDGFVNEDDVDLRGESGDEIDADVENIQAELNHEESDTSDEEYHIARDRVKTCSNKLIEIAKRLQREAGEGKLPSQQAKLKEPITTVQAIGEEGFESEYFESEDDLDSPVGSEDEGQIKRRSNRSMLVSCDSDFSKFQWKVGQRFPSREEFRQAVAKYAILQGRNLGFVVSNKARRQQLGVKCIKGYPFYLFSSWHSKKGSFIVKTVNSEHRPHWPAKEISDTIKLAYKALVGSYVAAIRAASPQTVIELVIDGSKESNPPIFQRLFNCFDGLKKGWKEGCRRIICVDAAFLKTFLGGQILSAIGRDPNDQMFPIAWAVVEGENNLSWEWFFTHLQSCLDLGDGTGLAIASDEHPAIVSAVQTVLPQAEHRHCARHVYANWQKRGFRGGEMKQAFWKVAKAYNQTDYNEALGELEEASPLAATAFRSFTPETFCRAFMDPAIKCDAITNNMAETFNGYIINARTHHLLYMMEEIRGALMKSVKWDMRGLPCCHAIACIYFMNKEAEPYVDDWYKREVYLRVYGQPIPALVGERHWPKVDRKFSPPPIKIGSGRPRKNRIKDPYENPKKPGKLTRHGMEMTCKKCNQKGHNKRSCKEKDTAIPQEPQPKKPRGRPRKYTTPTPTPTDEAGPSHHGITAHPTQLGRGGRMILGGLGSRGRGTGRGNAGGRGSGGAGGGRGQYLVLVVAGGQQLVVVVVAGGQ